MVRFASTPIISFPKGRVVELENASETELLYRTYKPVMVGVAYRMLGSVMDAEDIVHEVFLSINTEALSSIRNLKAYLCKIVTNRCIDRLRSTMKHREVYVGPWLPEPLVLDDDNVDPSLVYEGKEMISTAYLLLLQQLSWVERAVFVFREVLQFDYTEIAEIVDKSPSNCRQIFHRAKRSLGTHGDVDASNQFGVSDALNLQGSSGPVEGSTIAMEARQIQYERTDTLVRQFTNALASGNIQELVNILSADVTVYSDGGGRVKAAIYPIRGCDRVTTFFAGLLSKASAHFAYKHAVVNGFPGIVTYEGNKVSSVISFRVESDRVAYIYIVANPDKLGHVK